MKVSEIAKILDADILCCKEYLDNEVKSVYDTCVAYSKL